MSANNRIKAEPAAERAAVKLATGEATRPEASRFHSEIIISGKIKISQIWAKSLKQTPFGIAQQTKIEKKIPIFRATLLRSVISDTLTSFMVAGFWCNARTTAW
ncbi:hypothetical protein [Caballeronia cordobensis]|uniref:hypothetical protein n=1 Tax=Caballeronia cordobensis TaxID=1353886 RepID=UPI0011774002|nr:hypothetical protein [Caballeronia cordobensis]